MANLSIGASFVFLLSFFFTLNPVLFFHFEPFVSPLGLQNQHPNLHTDILTMVIPLFFYSNNTNSIGKPPGESKSGSVWFNTERIHKTGELKQEEERKTGDQIKTHKKKPFTL